MLALCRQRLMCARFGRTGLRLQLLQREALVAKNPDGARHIAEFVRTARIADLGIEPAGGDLAHRCGKPQQVAAQRRTKPRASAAKKTDDDSRRRTTR